MFHGDADPVVGVDHSRALVAAVQAAGGSAELIVYDGEGHGFRDPRHQLDEFARIGEFLRRIVT